MNRIFNSELNSNFIQSSVQFIVSSVHSQFSISGSQQTLKMTQFSLSFFVIYFSIIPDFSVLCHFSQSPIKMVRENLFFPLKQILKQQSKQTFFKIIFFVKLKANKITGSKTRRRTRTAPRPPDSPSLLTDARTNGRTFDTSSRIFW